MTFPAAQIRIARPTDRLEEVVRFYHEGLGLPILDGFQDHDGYDGVMIGLPDERTHLELIHHANGSPGTAPAGGSSSSTVSGLVAAGRPA